ncbi:unnamed protein product [Prorocentrum cordatum]|uniref:Uncharacterized protein n=1 Tax=Prorocentrum cordatum TaxID=2364126 RepID=A0ABN9VNA6_9DINO|nr:unnamed protein product [Polarella glacialis]
MHSAAPASRVAAAHWRREAGKELVGAVVRCRVQCLAWLCRHPQGPGPRPPRRAWSSYGRRRAAGTRPGGRSQKHASRQLLTYRSLPDLSRLCPHFEFMHVLVSCIGGIRFNCFVPTLSSVFPHYSFLPSPPSTTPKVPPLGAAQRRSALPRRVSAPVFANTF